jgi:hypothetical protein
VRGGAWRKTLLARVRARLFGKDARVILSTRALVWNVHLTGP